MSTQDSALDETKYVRCTSCDEEKPCAGFHKNLSKKSGFESHCKSCVSLRKKAAKAKKYSKLASQEKRRLNTKVLNVNNFVICESYAEGGFEDRNHIELLVKSFILSSGG